MRKNKIIAKAILIFYLLISINMSKSKANELKNNSNNKNSNNEIQNSFNRARFGISIGSGIYNSSSYNSQIDFSLFLEYKIRLLFLRADLGIFNRIKTKEQIIYNNSHGFEHGILAVDLSNPNFEKWGDFDLLSFDIGINTTDYLSIFVNLAISYYGKYIYCEKDDTTCRERKNTSNDTNTNTLALTAFGIGTQIYMSKKISMRINYMIRSIPHSIYRKLYSENELDRTVKGVNISFAYGLL